MYAMLPDPDPIPENRVWPGHETRIPLHAVYVLLQVNDNTPVKFFFFFFF